MKRILLTLLTVVMAVSVWGQTTDYTTGNLPNTGWYATGCDQELNGITWHCTATNASLSVSGNNLVITPVTPKGSGNSSFNFSFTIETAINNFGNNAKVSNVDITATGNTSYTTDDSNLTITVSGTTTKKNLNPLTLTSITVEVATPVTVNACGNASFCYGKALDFTNSDAKAYMVTGETENSITLTQIDKVPANTGIFVLGDGGSYDIPVMFSGETDDASANKLSATTEPKVIDGTENIWALSKSDGKLHPVTSGTIGVGKAYLVSEYSAATLARGFSFNEIPTSINAVANTTSNSVAYNLAGQRVAANAKGIVVINGKKFINK